MRMALLFLLLFSLPALADTRSAALEKQLRCPVCQGGSIHDSAAPLAADLRKIVRERIDAGDTDAEVLAYLQARYGDYILLDPPFRATTVLLWIAPFLVFCLGAGVVFRPQRRG